MRWYFSFEVKDGFFFVCVFVIVRIDGVGFIVRIFLVDGSFVVFLVKMLFLYLILR